MVTPRLQWDTSENAGFGVGTPWMRVNEDYKDWNVQDQLKRLDSVLAFWKRALRLRKEHEVLVRYLISSPIIRSLTYLKVYGDFRLHDGLAHHETVFAFSRNLGDASAVVLLNYSDKEATVNFEHRTASESPEPTLLLSNYDGAGAEAQLISMQHRSFSAHLRGYEGRIYLL